MAAEPNKPNLTKGPRPVGSPPPGRVIPNPPTSSLSKALQQNLTQVKATAEKF